MPTPINYHYHSHTFEFLSQSDATVDPLGTEKAAEVVYLGPPAFATNDAPPAVQPNECAVYNNGAWTVVPDHRGTTYWLADGSRYEITDLGVVPPGDALTDEPIIPPTADELVAEMERAMEAHMDAVAQADGWDNRWTCVTRAGYTNPWQAKGAVFGQWMDSCWVYSQQVLADVQAGTRAIPTAEELIAELPTLVWPA